MAPGTSDSSKWPPVSLRVSTGPGTDENVTDVERMTSSVYWKSQVNFVVYSAINVSCFNIKMLQVSHQMKCLCVTPTL